MQKDLQIRNIVCYFALPLLKWGGGNKMECNCIENSENKILKHLGEKHPTWIIKDARYNNMALMMDFELIRNSLYFEFGYEYSFPKVNGEMSKPKRSTVSITPAFCPFCGVKLNGD